MLSLRCVSCLMRTVILSLPLIGGVAQASTALYMQSQTGDYLGQGTTYTYSAPADTFGVTASATGIDITVDNTGPSWMLSFRPPAGKSLTNGVYEGAQRYPFNAPGAPGMDVSGEGRGCNTESGRFEIFNLKTDTHGAVISFALQFEDHCEGGPAALFGQILYNASGGIIGPHVSVATARTLKGNVGTSDGLVTLSLSRPSHRPVSVSYATVDASAKAGRDYLQTQGTVTFPRETTTQYVSVPIIGDRRAESGRSFEVVLSAPVGAPLGVDTARMAITDPNGPQTVLAMTSQSGDYIGGGLPWLQTSFYTSFSTSFGTGTAEIRLGDPQNWTLDFAAPSGASLAPGFYANAQRYPFQPSTVPGLSVYGDGAGCNTLTGNFTINEDSAALDSFSADFQQNCEGGSAALFGSIRINEVLQQISVTNAVVDSDGAAFIVTVNPVASSPVYAIFNTLDGTARAGVDYKPVSTLVTIPAGAGGAYVKVKRLGKAAAGKVFYGTITSTSLPPVWIFSGSARL